MNVKWSLEIWDFCRRWLGWSVLIRNEEPWPHACRSLLSIPAQKGHRDGWEDDGVTFWTDVDVTSSMTYYYKAVIVAKHTLTHKREELYVSWYFHYDFWAAGGRVAARWRWGKRGSEERTPLFHRFPPPGFTQCEMQLLMQRISLHTWSGGPV